MAILITGGAGYIGTHAMVEFLEAGKEIVCVDNFSNSKPEALERVRRITGKDFKFYKVDLLDRDALEQVFKEKIAALTVASLLDLKGTDFFFAMAKYLSQMVGVGSPCTVCISIKFSVA